AQQRRALGHGGGGGTPDTDRHSRARFSPAVRSKPAYRLCRYPQSGAGFGLQAALFELAAARQYPLAARRTWEGVMRRVETQYFASLRVPSPVIPPARRS